MNKLVLSDPNLDIIKEKLSCDFPEEIQITFKSKKDNGRELEIIDYLIRSVGYYFEKIKPIDDAKTMYIVHFKRKS